MNYYYRLTKTNDNKLSKRGIKIPAVIKEKSPDAFGRISFFLQKTVY